MSEEISNPFQDQIQAEREESSVKDFEADQEKNERREEQIIERAEKEKEQEEEFKEKKERQKFIQRENKEKLKQEKSELKIEKKKRKNQQRLQRIINYYDKLDRKKIKASAKKGSKDGALIVGRVLGFHNKKRSVKSRKKLSSRERLEKQIRDEEKKLQRLRTKLLRL